MGQINVRIFLVMRTSNKDIENSDMEKLFEHDEIAGLMPSVLCLYAFAPYFKIVQFLKICSMHLNK
jgi:hypothetical protein